MWLFYLRLESVDDPWMAVALVDCAVGTEEVIVPVALYVPHKYACNRYVQLVLVFNNKPMRTL